MNIESQLALVVKGVRDLLGAGCAGQAPGFGIHGIHGLQYRIRCSVGK